MADTSREPTPAPDASYLATVPDEFSHTTTELELLLTDPDSLLSPPRFPLDDLHSKRIIYRLRHYILVLRTNDAIWKRRTEELAVILRQRHEEFGPPPAWPFNDAAWHQWLLQTPSATLAAHEMFDLGPMPLPAPWDAHAPFTTPLQLIEHLDATWDVSASQWGDVAASAVTRAEEELERRRARAAQLRDERAGRSSGQQRDGPIASAESTELVLGHLNPIDVYLRDPQAPTLRRHCYYTSYALFSAPREPSGVRVQDGRTVLRPRDLIYIRTNVDYIPPLPPRILALLRTDGCYGPHEISRWAQWHEVGYWHHAFIPLGRRDGRVHLNEHSEVGKAAHDIAWYVPDLAQHFTLCGNGQYVMQEKLSFVLDYAWNTARNHLETSRDKYPSLVGQPYSALDTGRRALNLLRSHQLNQRDIVETMASFQRCLLEIRGWNEFVRCRMWLKKFSQQLNNPSILPPADARDSRTRRWVRGVFTHSADIAMRYGQYGVPVFLVQVVPPGFVPPPTDFVPEGPVVITQTLHCRYACEAWNNVRLPPHLAAVQEPGFALQPEKQGPPEDAPPDEDAPQDDEPMQQHDDDVVMYDEPRAPQDDEQRAPQDEQRAPQDEPRAPQDDEQRAPQDDEQRAPQDEPRKSQVVEPVPAEEDVVMDKEAPATGEVAMEIQVEPPPLHAAASDVLPGGSKKRVREDAKETETINSEGGTTKTAKRQKGEGSSKEGEQPVRQQQPKFRFPYNRRNKPVPDWWPETWTAATTALANTIGRDGTRLAMLAETLEYPVDTAANPGRLVRVPIIEQFYGKKDELKTSRMISYWLQMRGARMRTFATVPIRDVSASNAEDWRKITSANVHPALQAAFARQLGFEIDAPAVRIVVEEPEALVPLQIDGASRPSSPSTSTSLSTSAPPSTAPSTPPTTRPSTPNAQYSDDDSDEEDMTQIDAAGRPIFPEHSCFVPVVDDRTSDGTLLAREDERYLKEPPGWRVKQPGQHRGYKEFALFVDDARGEDNVLEFRRIGESRRKDGMEEYTEFWDYEGGRILFVLDPIGQRRGGGEHVTRPLRLLPFEGSKYVPMEPIQLHVWPAQSLQAKLHVPREPLGAVGSRARTSRFRLSDEHYAKVFPGAPLPGAPLPGAPLPGAPLPDAPPRRATPSAATTESATGGATPARQLEPSAQSSTSAITPASSATRGSDERHASDTPAPGMTIVARTSSPEPRDTRGDLTAEAPQVRSRRADLWAAQGAISVAKEGAPTPLHDLLMAKGNVFFNGHILPPFADDPPPSYAWPSREWRAYIFWDLAELTFRTAVFALDNHLRRTYPDLNKESELTRQQMLCDIWADSTFVPSGPSPLTAADWRTRVDPIRAFHRVASSWPRTTFSLPADFASEADFLVFEGTVWLAYTQTYSDYFLREPPVPLVCPESVPWGS